MAFCFAREWQENPAGIGNHKPPQIVPNSSKTFQRNLQKTYKLPSCTRTTTKLPANNYQVASEIGGGNKNNKSNKVCLCLCPFRTHKPTQTTKHHSRKSRKRCAGIFFPAMVINTISGTFAAVSSRHRPPPHPEAEKPTRSRHGTKYATRLPRP